MKISDLLEARRGGDSQNPKIPVNQAVLDHLESAGSIAGIPNSFVSFTSVDKLGINPKSQYNTPLGIYAYPSEYVKDEVGENESMENLPFAGHQPFANIFSASGKIINLTTLSDTDVSELYRSLAKAYHREKGGEWKRAVDDVQGHVEAAQYHAAFKSYPGGQLWYVTRSVAKDMLTGKYSGSTAPVIWNKVFRMMGVDGCVDMDPATHRGVGITHVRTHSGSILFNHTYTRCHPGR